ncbi:MAG: FTR1 family protein [Synechococcales bacterium]|nr:FTR1 family protein [Synechococcales bacterium]
MDISGALPTFVVTLREGVEAALVVGIVLAYLNKANQRHLNPWVYGGIATGIVASVLVGILFTGLLLQLETAEQSSARILKPFLEAVFSAIAIGLLSWMLIWMTQQARSLKSEVETTVATALQSSGRAGWGVFGLILVAVLREGFETVIFIAAQFQGGWVPVAGAIAGLVGATIIGFLLFQLGVKINLRLFFQGMGVLLLLIVAGLVVGTLRHLDAAALRLTELYPAYSNLCFSPGPSCLLGPQVWDTSGVLPDREFPGILLKAFFGYTQHLYLAQAVGYVAFLLTVGTIYLQSILPATSPPKTSQT